MKIISGLFFVVLISGSKAAFAQPGEWTWLHGSTVQGSAGNYGTQGVSSPLNEPTAVYEPMEWTDQNGNFWMYGGRTLVGDFLNALWKYDPVTNEWTWMTGLSTANDPGNYGTQGVSSPLNRPPARGWAASTWVDLNNNLWVFGGDVGGFGGYSDLWKYDITTNEWTWMKGPNTTGNNGVYGTQGVPGPLNNPGCRWECAGSWTDNTGDLWLFGGYNGGTWNDLWRYQISTNEWTWMKGSQISGALAVYGTQGVEAPGNTPCARGSYSRWKDNSGNLWVFGGDYLNQVDDMWRYNISTNNWMWVSGTSLPNPAPFYGTKCVSSPSNTPGGRNENRACWTDQNGNFWFFGGNNNGSLFNDLWMYCVATKEWTWVAGDTIINASGNWGTINVSSPLNKPDARAGSVSWTDGNGTLYFFGGSAVPFASASMNDLWKYVIDPGCSFCNSVPVAIFTAPNHICPGTCTDFMNQSVNATSFQWTFAGANPGTSTDVSPTNICYNTPGVYSVTLIATNANGSDTLTLNNFITVYPYPPPQGIAQSGDTLFANTGAVTYQWYLNGVIILGATDYFYVAQQSGNYNVVATDNNDCEVEAAIFDVVASTGSEVSGFEFEVYPNPVSDELFIEFNKAGSGLKPGTAVEVCVYGVIGEKILSLLNTEVPNKMDVSGLSAGVYDLEMRAGEKIFRTKFVKQ